jgi:undecaprenyl-diphosphatase
VVALWPGTSRSFVTILAALALGCSLTVAVEFSFLLGFVTLSAATGYELLKHGSTLVDHFGVLNPVIGVVFAGITAVIAVKWMVTYLERHPLTVFGWYRIGVGALVAVLLVTKAI